MSIEKFCLIILNLVLLITNLNGLRVENLKELNKDSSSITIEWSVYDEDSSILLVPTTGANSNNNNNENEWIGFKIKYFTDKLKYTPVLLKNINLRKFRLDNLKSNTDYKIQVSAVNKLDLEGPASNLLNIKTHESVPGEPQDCKVTKVTSNSIDLEWRPPKREDPSTSHNIKGYEIHYFKVNPTSSSSSQPNDFKPDSQIFKRKTNDVKKLKYTLTDLEPNSLYKIQIFAYNMKGDGQRSAPLLVNTPEEGPNKPESIRSEIENDNLVIRWQQPMLNNEPQSVAGYRIYFNNEKYDVDANTNFITFQRPKWEFDHNYEFRISAKANKNSNAFGQEAVYRISTHTSQSKLSIQFEKLTSTSILVRWNNIQFTSSKPNNKIHVHYLVQYWLKSDPKNINNHDKINNTELQLTNLRPNSDYIIQIAAFGTPLNRQQTSLESVMSTEPTIKHFKTLISDIEAPQNLQLNRYEPDKINIKWDPVIMIDPDTSKLKTPISLIKGYRIYFRESNYNDDYNYDALDNNGSGASSEEWKTYDQVGDKNTDISLSDFNVNKDYIFKVVAYDYSNNEGPESQAQIAYRLNYDSNVNSNENYENANSQLNDNYNSNINGEVGTPRDLEIIEYTSTSIKFGWMPPATQSRITSFLISYIDRPKFYRESNGSIVTFHKGIGMNVRVPARDDPTIKITWLVSGLLPNTEYDVNISAIMANDVQGLPIQKRIKTRRDRPSKVDKPFILDIYTDNTVLIATGNASERNGPIAKYWLVITPMIFESTLKSKQKDQKQENKQQQFQNYETRERDITNLLRYSIYNASLSNESTYITAEFEAVNWPTRFILGDGNKYGRFFNRRLNRNIDYKAYIIAFTDETANKHDQQKSNQANLLGLGDILSSKPSNNFIEGDLFSASFHSDIFNTRNLEANQNAIRNTLGGFGIGIGDFHNILWVAGAVASIIFLFVIVIVLTLHVMHKKTKHINNSHNTNTLSNRNISTLTRNQVNQHHASATSSTTTTTNLLMSSKQPAIDTQVQLNKHTGSIQTSTIKRQQSEKQAPSSSSSSSSTTASPTTALLSCSVNNTSSNNNVATVGSQSSQNTNNTNILPLTNTNGLLTAASPLKLPSESLYTSIEVSQKLLQQSSFSNNNNFDHQQMMLMMMMNNNNNNNMNSTFGANTSTLSRNQQTLLMNHSLTHNYDPIEYRRLNFQTPTMQLHPQIHVDELFQYIERLKSQNNAKFTLEYESIDPSQHFTWEHSIMELNRSKNRYANVIAYDHSRVILTKLPPVAYKCNSNISSSSGYNTTSNYSTLNRHDLDMLMNGNVGASGLLPSPPPPPPGMTSIPPSPSALSNHSDYINANYIDGYRKRNCYIATQGPLTSTTADFWRMIWEQQTCTIVMLTKLEERSRLKCDQYWPNKGTEVYDNCMQVTLVDFTELSTYSIRTFVISPVNTYAQMQIANNANNINFEMRREVKHFQYTAWPDHGVPDHPTTFLMFVRRIRNSNPMDSGPIVAHCSAGVGRTGCYLAIDTMLERLRHEKTIDIYGYVTCMRSQRNYMIQTEEQYIFCYDSVLEASQCGNTEVPARNLYSHLQRLLQITSDDPSLMLTEMELEYKRLSNIKAPQSKFQSANLPANKFKNRLVNILPYESTRVILQQLPNTNEMSGSDYINANFVDGYKYKKAYIATQAPLVETVDDFWRMLWEHNSTIIVMLTKLREMGREKCSQYWPSERSIRYQYFVVDPIAEYNMNQYILREFKVTDARDGQSRTIRQFQFIDWPEQGVPKSGESIIELIGQVHKTKEQFGQTGPITVHCSAGVGRTGVFITLSIVLERMRYEGIIDVFNTVKVLRTQRPAMVQTEDQYQFCYRAALEYLGSFENFE